MAESHVVSALKAKRAELAGETQAAEKRIAQLRADLVHVDAVLRMFDPTAEPDTIPARRPHKRRGWFGDGELPRRILDALRASPEPLSASEITRRVTTAKGLDAGDTSTVELIRMERPPVRPDRSAGQALSLLRIQRDNSLAAILGLDHPDQATLRARVSFHISSFEPLRAQRREPKPNQKARCRTRPDFSWAWSPGRWA